MVHDDARVGLDGLEVRFDDERVVSDAGITLVATLAGRLGIEGLVDRFVVLRRERPGAANAGRKVMALVFAMVLGADSIDDCELLRAGRTRRLLGGWIPAPSTLGTFLRAFTFGHVRQLDRVLSQALTRAWAAGAGPGDGRLVVDIDSFVGEVHGYHKQGTGVGYSGQRGYHPMLATRADSGEVLHIRTRKGNAASPRGVLRFADELIARVTRAGASGEKLLRADSAFWNKTLMARLENQGWLYSISIRVQKGISEQIALIAENDWTTLAEYPTGGEAQIAESTYGARRMIVRRTRLIGPQAELWPDWRHFPLLTNRTENIMIVESEHRQHAVVELTIRDLKDQALAHFPSGQFTANSAWTVIACLAHNLTRWTTMIGLPDHTIPTSRTVRRRLLAIPGRLTRSSRQWTLHLPARWPWQTDFTDALTNLRAIPRLA
jgi:Transposase DDE domain group 1